MSRIDEIMNNFLMMLLFSLLSGLAAVAMPVHAKEVSSIKLPAESAVFKPGKGDALMKSYCLICDSADYVSTQPPMTTEQWKGIVIKMQKVYGCPLPDSDVTALVNYLDSEYSPKP